MKMSFNTGPMHLAAMLGCPTLTLYFHGHEGTWFPYGEDGRAVHIALSPRCSRTRCLESCPEAAMCGLAIASETVATVWKTMWGKKMRNGGDRMSGWDGNLSAFKRPIRVLEDR